MEYVMRNGRRGLAGLMLLAITAGWVGHGCVKPQEDDSGAPAPDDGATRIEAIVPDRGITDGGTLVTIEGENFSSDMEVLFGGFMAEETQVVNDTTITAVTPAQTVGAVDVVVRSAVTGQVAITPGGFVYSKAVTPSAGPMAGGTRVTIIGSGFSADAAVLFGTDAASDIQILHSTVLTCLTPPHAAGVVDVSVRHTPTAELIYSDAFTYTTSADAEGGPRLVSAISTSNTSVLATFSEALGEGADNAANYGIVQANVNAESAALAVLEAEPSADGVTVLLTTASQNEVTYELHVTGIRDLDGNPLAAPSLLLDPTMVTFAGTPAAFGGPDTDCDGLPDAAEQYGWAVIIEHVNGSQTVRTVTSDAGLSWDGPVDADDCPETEDSNGDPIPNPQDTDSDGLTDAEEKGIGSDPRSGDTDADGINDYDEWNVWYSDPTDQDSDEDGLADGLEIDFFATSAILADSDGDQMEDGEELFERNRNPLLADLPVPQITVGSIRLDVEITSSFTDEEGVTTEISDSSSTSFAQSRSDTLGTSSTTSTEAENKFSQELGFELGGSVKDGFAGKATGKTGFEQSRSQGFSSTVDRETAKASQQEWQRSISNALSQSENRSVTRNIDGAIIQAAVNLANRSDIAFSITNLELSVLQQDRRSGLNFQPIATLRPSNDDTPTYNLGPLDGERGPIIFESINVFPNLVEDLMREPTGLVFKVVNFDILDEFGRNFAFSSQEVVERTVGIDIDFGDGLVEKYRVATTSSFDENGLPVGISLQRALEIAGITKREGDDSGLTVPSPLTPEIRNSYGVVISSTNVERLTRVRGVQNEFVTSGTDPTKRAWVVLVSDVDLPEDTDFSEIPVSAGDTIQLWFTSDADEDGLFAREEYLYGSSDSSDDSDDDGLDDFFEVRTGWSVNRLPGLPYKVFPDPARADSDLDGLSDEKEFDEGTDPHRADTDEDGIPDKFEIEGPLEVVLFDGDADETNDVILVITPYERVSAGIVRSPLTGLAGDDQRRTVIAPGPDGTLQTSAVSGDDVLVRKTATALEFHWGANNTSNTTPSGDDVAITYIAAGANGVVDTVPADGEFITVAHDRLFATDPLNRDTDQDGLPDGRELIVGTNPNASDAGKVVDSDNDGLSDNEETAGWTAVVNGQNVAVTSNPLRADTDLDGIVDVFERAIGSNPRNRDTDGDTLSDLEEWDPDDQDNYYSNAAMEDALRRCDEADACFEPAVPDTVHRTNIVKADSDADTVNDNIELSREWFVNAIGPDGAALDPVKVSSKPYRADDDGDGLKDAEEFAKLTNPSGADSDTDGTDDGDETVTCFDHDNNSATDELCRDPLTADRLLVFKYVSFQTVFDCDDSPDDGAEVESSEADPLGLTLPDGSQATADVPGIRDECAGEGVGTLAETITLSFERTFLLRVGQSFTARSRGTWNECDAGGRDPLGSFSTNFAYLDVAEIPPDTTTPFSGTILATGSTEGSCEFRINFSVQSKVTEIP